MHDTLKVVEQPGLVLALPAMFFDYGTTIMGQTLLGQDWHGCSMYTDVQVNDYMRQPAFCTRDCGHDNEDPGQPNDPIHMAHTEEHVVAAWMETIAPLPSLLDPRIVRSLSELNEDSLLAAPEDICCGMGTPVMTKLGEFYYYCTRPQHDDLLHVADDDEKVVAVWLAVKA